jgi:hypothetical protein
MNAQTASAPRAATVTAYHNLDGMLFHYKPDHRVVPVFHAELPEHGATDRALCERIFVLLNVGHDPEFTSPPDPLAVEYRQHANRGLCAGDVVAVERSAGSLLYYAVGSRGFTQIEPPTVVRIAEPGTTPLP